MKLLALLFISSLLRESFADFPSYFLSTNHQRVTKVSSGSSQKSTNESLCRTQLSQFSQALSNGDDWAVRLTDTWVKVPAGYLSGNRKHPGDYDSCVNFRHDAIQGQHCWITLNALDKSTIDDDRIDLSLKN